MKAQESGQALVESLFVIPLFFILLSGVIFVFYQQIRNVIDDSAYASLKLSQAFFDSEERRLAKWSYQDDAKEKALKDVAYGSLNSSNAFLNSVDMKEGVFLDKKKISSYSVSLKNPGEFDFSTQADKQAYERSSFSFDHVLSSFASVKHSYFGKSLYYPDNSFSWSERPFEAAEDSRDFLMSAKGILFSKNYASLSLGNSYFTSNCFMEPFKPQCHLHPIFGKFDRAAKDGANTQLAECVVEMSAECLPLGAPPAIAVCEAKGIALIIASIEMGKQSSLCPITNSITIAAYQAVKALIYADLLKNSAYEIKKRSEILKK